MSKAFVSLGGWCGPALALSKLEMRQKAFPFDFSRVTFDGIIYFVQNGFDLGFFPTGKPPFRPECVGQWVLFRSQHCAFAHYNLNDRKVQEGFSRKISRFKTLLESAEEVVFLRTITARNPRDEISLVPGFVKVIQDRYPDLKYRLVMMAHDQPINRTECFGYLGEKNVSIWNLKYDRDNLDDRTSLFDMTFDGYRRIIETSSSKSHWESLRPWKRESQVWNNHNNLALIDGEAMVRGTCGGFGSTGTPSEMTCLYCNTEDSHKVMKAPLRREWTKEDDDLILTYTYTLLLGHDAVQIIEDLADQLRRDALEVIERIHHLTNARKLLDSLSLNLLTK